MAAPLQDSSLRAERSGQRLADVPRRASRIKGDMVTACWSVPHRPQGPYSPGSRSAGARNLVLPKYRAVIFINGCFWHGHRGCTKYVEPKTNAGFWKEKIARNIARDELNAQRLDTLAWTVITVWECELSKKNLDATITRIEADLQTAKTKYEHYLSIRRENREFARKQAQKHREILAQVEAELNLPKSLRRYATKSIEEE